MNFGRIADPELQGLLDAGRVEPEGPDRDAIYEDLNRRFASEVYNIWLSTTIWAVATQDDVQAILGGPLPGGEAPFPGLATGHMVDGIWMAS